MKRVVSKEAALFFAAYLSMRLFLYYCDLC
nr:MAG TPA: hypothetical protein [Caudoviricetes sp.]